ncbi:MAG TPA: metal-dependent hydrolase [archaeon]|nr:metal-dependent hydrolase [archaeon]
MDWISHIIFGLAMTRLAFISRPAEWHKYRSLIVLIAVAASLFPDLDILTTHRSELHAPIVLLAIAIIIGLAYPLSFKPLLSGLLSHTLLDIFLFDNSQGTIRNIIDLVVTNDTAAAEINNTVTTKVAAEGIMLLYPFSQKMYYLLLTEQTYPMIMAAVLFTGVVTLYLTRYKT